MTTERGTFGWGNIAPKHTEFPIRDASRISAGCFAPRNPFFTRFRRPRTHEGKHDFRRPFPESAATAIFPRQDAKICGVPRRENFGNTALWGEGIPAFVPAASDFPGTYFRRAAFSRPAPEDVDVFAPKTPQFRPDGVDLAEKSVKIRKISEKTPPRVLILTFCSYLICARVFGKHEKQVACKAASLSCSRARESGISPQSPPNWKFENGEFSFREVARHFSDIGSVWHVGLHTFNTHGDLAVTDGYGYLHPLKRMLYRTKDRIGRLLHPSRCGV